MKTARALTAILFIFFSLEATAQQVLPDYDGYWTRGDRQVSVLDLLQFYPDGLGLIRNEIFARYGRAFATERYQSYFGAQGWYQIRDNYSDSWPDSVDMANAKLIFTLERPKLGESDFISQVLNTIEYSSGQAVLTFTSSDRVIWTDPHIDFGMYALNGYNAHTLNWTYLGDWILTYEMDWDTESYFVIAYKLDHATASITETVWDPDFRVSPELLTRITGLK